MIEKWYEIPIASEKNYIDQLNLKYFPNSNETHRKILKEWFALSILSFDEISYTPAYDIAAKNQIEVKEIIKIFGNQVVNVDNDRQPKKIRLVRLYKPLLDESFESIRVAKDYYEALRTLKRIEASKNLPYTNAEYTAKELEAGLTKSNCSSYPNIHERLLDVWLLNIGGHPTDPPKDYEPKYSINLKVLDPFDDWYKKDYLPCFSYLPGVNKVETQTEVYDGADEADEDEIGFPINSKNKLANLHPDIFNKCHELYEKKAYTEAVEKSFKVVRDKLRKLTGFETGSEAFGRGKLYIEGAAAQNVDEDFNSAVKFLTMAIDRFRNEKSHTSDSKIKDPIRAYEYLCISSLTMRFLDDTDIRQ